MGKVARRTAASIEVRRPLQHRTTRGPVCATVGSKIILNVKTDPYGQPSLMQEAAGLDRHMDNTHIEAAYADRRDDCLNVSRLLSIADARRSIEVWSINSSEYPHCVAPGSLSSRQLTEQALSSRKGEQGSASTTLGYGPGPMPP